MESRLTATEDMETIPPSTEDRETLPPNSVHSEVLTSVFESEEIRNIPLNFGDATEHTSSLQESHNPQISLVDEVQDPVVLTPLELRLQNFAVPEGYQRSLIPKKSSGRSVIYEYGVRVKDIRSGKLFELCYCLATETCGEAIRISANTSNASDHLTRVHGIKGKRSQQLLKKKTDMNKKLSKEKLRFMRSDPNRYHELNFCKLMVKKMLPFSFSEGLEFRLFMEMLDDKGHFRNQLHASKVKKLVLEMYLSTTASLSNNISIVKSLTPLPMFHLNFDLWKSSVCDSKFAGLRVCYVNDRWEIESNLLAVRAYRPFIGVEEVRLSELLNVWSEDVLKEYNLSSGDICSSTTDAGSDVKRMCSKLMTADWDWCICHLLNCALVEAFGTELRPSSCRNFEFRKLIKLVKSIVEHLNKSHAMRIRFQDLQFEKVGSKLKLVKDMPHRWLGTIKLMERFLKLWHILREHYATSESISFPLEGKADLLVECFSLMKPIGDIIITAQATTYPSGIDAFLSLCSIKKSVLCPATPLPIFDPTDPSYERHHKPKMERRPAMLQALTARTRELLSEAISKRFYSGYSGFPRSRLLEMQVFLHPAYKSLRCLEAIMTPGEANSLSEAVESDILGMALKVANYQRNNSDFNDAREESPQKKQRRSQETHNRTLMSNVFSLHMFEDQDSLQGPDASTLRDVVVEEINNYKRNEKISSTELPTRRLLNWWRKMASRYPHLSMVARSVLGHPASSAQIERDFGSAGALLSSKRNRLDAAFVDMCLTLNANFESIPYKIPEIPGRGDGWTNKIPHRLVRQDALSLIEVRPVDGSEDSDIDCGLWE